MTVAAEMLLNSEKSTEPTERWIKLKLEPEDDPNDNQVGGELHIRYRYKAAARFGKLLFFFAGLFFLPEIFFRCLT